MATCGGGGVVDLLSNFCSRVWKWQNPKFSWFGGEGGCWLTPQLLFRSSEMTKSQGVICVGENMGYERVVNVWRPSWTPDRWRPVLRLGQLILVGKDVHVYIVWSISTNWTLAYILDRSIPLYVYHPGILPELLTAFPSLCCINHKFNIVSMEKQGEQSGTTFSNPL